MTDSLVLDLFILTYLFYKIAILGSRQITCEAFVALYNNCLNSRLLSYQD